MSRSDVLVDADWVQENLDDPNVAVVEVDEAVLGENFLGFALEADRH